MSWFADSMKSHCGTQVESGAIVAAGAVVSPGRTVPSGEVWAGAPAKRLRALEPEEAGFLAQAASDYAALAAVHAAENAKSLEEILARPVLCIYISSSCTACSPRPFSCRACFPHMAGGRHIRACHLCIAYSLLRSCCRRTLGDAKIISCAASTTTRTWESPGTL